MMAGACPYCDRSYRRAASCDYLKHDPVPLPFEAPDGMRCPSCNVAPGRPHHAYCERADCGACGGPFSDCGGIECGGHAA